MTELEQQQKRRRLLDAEYENLTTDIQEEMREVDDLIACEQVRLAAA